MSDVVLHSFMYKNLLECLAVVNDGDHVLNVALRQLSVSQVILFVKHHLLSVPAHNSNNTDTFVRFTQHFVLFTLCLLKSRL